MALLDDVKQIAITIVDEFSTQGVESILLHGSILFNPHITPQDVDLVIVLRVRKDDDCLRLGNIFQILGGSSNALVQLHLIYLSELPRRAEWFSIHTSGSFFVQHLKQALVLHGVNVFQQIQDPSQEQLLISLLQKIQQYTATLRNNLAYLTAITTADMRQARKRTINVLKDLLMARGILIQRNDEIVAEAVGQFPEFTETERAFLTKISTVTYRLPGIPESLQFFEKCLVVHEKAYLLLRTQISKECSVDFLQ